MSQIDKLLNKHAPDGVVLKPLGDVGEFVRGNGLQKSDLTSVGVGAIHYGQIHTHYGTWTRTTKSFVAPEMAAKLRRARTGDLVIATTSEDDAAVAKAMAWLGPDEVAVSGDAYIYRHTLDPRYAAYFFQTEQFRAQKNRHISGTKVRRISGAALAKILIPVPPLEVQREIVRILDNFTELEVELEAELEARRRQYASYKDKLFWNVSARRSVSLGDISIILNGFSFRSENYSNSGVRVIRISDVQKGYISDKDRKYYSENQELEYRRYSLHEGDLVLSLSGSVGRVAMLSESDLPAALNQRVACVRPDPSVLTRRFLFHFLNRDQFEDAAILSAGSGTVKNVSSRWLREYQVPLVPLHEQAQIVALLDHFDLLINDISVGLPAELAARRKQYEYYRDRLLTFEETPA